MLIDAGVKHRMLQAGEVAEAFGLYAYDAYVLEAARTQRTPLLTLDRQLLRVAAANDIAGVEVSI